MSNIMITRTLFLSFLSRLLLDYMAKDNGLYYVFDISIPFRICYTKRIYRHPNSSRIDVDVDDEFESGNDSFDLIS